MALEETEEVALVNFRLAVWTNPTWNLNMQERRLFNECVDSTAVPDTTLSGGDSIGSLNCNAVLEAEKSCSSIITCFAVQFVYNSHPSM